MLSRLEIRRINRDFIIIDFIKILKHFNKIKLVSGIMHINPLIFFVYPGPMGSEENQFTPPGDGVNKLIFKRYGILYS
jgi:hypothetical protein